MALIVAPRAVRAERGATLLEVVAAVAVSSVFLSSAASTITTTAVELRRQRLAYSALDLARSRLEAAIAYPCAAVAACPEPFDCKLEREIALAPSVDRPWWAIRLRSSVRADTLGGKIALTTLVARDAGCPT